MTAAPALGPAPSSIEALIEAAEAAGDRAAWTYHAPPNVLLYPDGETFGAVADIMDVTHDPTSHTIKLTLDVVHQPNTISELEDHPDQQLQGDAQHYHFFTPAGVEVDAAKLLRMLPAATADDPAPSVVLPAVHMFIKGTGPCQGKPNGFECRAETACKNATVCDGVNNACPASTNKPDTTVCRDLPCAQTATCVSGSCPAPLFWPNRTMCREETACAEATFCTGSAAACPPRVFKSASTICREETECSDATFCTGSTTGCPTRTFKPATTKCRDANVTRGCEKDTFCTGSTASCPDTPAQDSGVVCRPATRCALQSVCDGTSLFCARRVRQPAGTECRDPIPGFGCMDVAVCDGESVDCPNNGNKTAGTVCRAANGLCDPEEVCSGDSAECPADANTPDGTACPFSLDAAPSQSVKQQASFGVSYQVVDEATAKAKLQSLTAEPSHYRQEWPACTGLCSSGVCSLTQGAGCCYTVRESATTTRSSGDSRQAATNAEAVEVNSAKPASSKGYGHGHDYGYQGDGDREPRYKDNRGFYGLFDPLGPAAKKVYVCWEPEEEESKYH